MNTESISPYFPKRISGRKDPAVKLIGHIRTKNHRREVYGTPCYARASLLRLARQWECEHPRRGYAEALTMRIRPDDDAQDIEGPIYVAEDAHRTIMQHPRFEPLGKKAEDKGGILAGWIHTDSGHREVWLCKNPRAACLSYCKQIEGGSWSVDSLWDNLGTASLWNEDALHPLFLGLDALNGFIGHPKFAPKEPIKEEAKKEEPELIGWVKADDRRIPTYIVDDPYAATEGSKNGAHGYRGRRLVDLMNSAISWHHIRSLYFTPAAAEDCSHPCFIPNDGKDMTKTKGAQAKEPELPTVMCTGCNLVASECSGNYLSCVNTTYYPVPDRFVDRHVSQKAWDALKEADRRAQAPYPDDVAEAGY